MTAGSVPEDEGDRAHADVASGEQGDRAQPVGVPADEQRAGDRSDRHAAPDQTDLDTAALQLVDHEHDEQHDEESLSDLSEAVDEHERPDLLAMEHDAQAGANTRVHRFAGCSDRR